MSEQTVREPATLFPHTVEEWEANMKSWRRCQWQFTTALSTQDGGYILVHYVPQFAGAMSGNPWVIDVSPADIQPVN